MNKRKILSILLLTGASVAAVGGGASHLNLNMQRNDNVLLSRPMNNKKEGNSQEKNNSDSNKNENTIKNKVESNTQNTTLSKKEVKDLKNKTIEAYGMKFSGLKAVKIAPNMPTGEFAAAPGFNPNGFASGVNEQLYNYELNPNNDKAAMSEATYLHGGNPIDTCVFFQSSALRAIGEEVPDYIGYTTHLENWLADNGWTRHEDFQFIQRGDLCFASYYHTFLFMGWENKAKGIAYVMGNESFTEPYYRNRNLNGQSPVTYGNNSYYQATCYWTYGQGYTGVTSEKNPVHPGGYNAIGTATTTSVLNIRGEANSWSNILGSVPSGVTVPVIAQDGAWYKVYYNGATGWIDGNYTKGLDESLGNGSAPTTMPQGDNLTVTSPTGLWLTYGPSANSGNIVSLPNGTPVRAIGWHDGWYKVNYEGTIGWLDAEYTNANGKDILSSSHNVSAVPQQKQKVSVPTQSGVQGTLTINSPIGLWMCNGPNANSGNIVVVPSNTQLTYKGEENGWYEVNYNGETGWVDGEYVNINGNQQQKTVVNSNNRGNQSKPIVQNSMKTATVNSSIGLWLNENPSMGSGIEVMPYGSTMKVLGQQGNWTKVDYNGTVGWCYTQYINISQNSSTPANSQSTGNSSVNNSSTSNKVIGTTTITSPIGLWQLGSPSMGGSHIQVIPDGTKVNVYGEQNGWYKVSYNGQVGWSYAQYTSGLSENKAIAENKLENSQRNTPVDSTQNSAEGATVNSPIGLWLNARPSMGSGMEVMPCGATMKVLGEQGDWTKVDYNGNIGWCYTQYININKNSNATTTSNQPIKSSSVSNNVIGNTTITSPIGLWQLGSPSMGGSHIQVIPDGAKVNVYGEQNGWYKVSYNGQIGWSYAKYTSGLNNNQSTATNESGNAIVNSPIGLWINAGPSMGNRIEIAPYNATVQVLGQQGDWTKVNYNGQVGWMYSSYLTF